MPSTTATSPTRSSRAATSTDTIYNGINAADVAVTNTDNDAAGITVTPTSGLTTTGSRRHGDVYGGADDAADRRRDDRAELERCHRRGRSRRALTFTTANWNVAQTVTVTGVDDDLRRRRRRLQRSSPPRRPAPTLIYNAINAADVAVTNTDDDDDVRSRGHEDERRHTPSRPAARRHTIVVTNAGPSGVVGATVTDTAPANVTFGTWTCAALGRVDVSRLRDGQHRGKREPRCRRHGDVHRPGVDFIGGQRHGDEYGDGRGAGRHDRSDTRE